MAFFDFTQAAQSGFETGRQAAGTSTMSKFITDLTERAKNMDLLKAKSAYDVQGQLAVLRPKAEIEADIQSKTPTGQFMAAMVERMKGLGGGQAPGASDAGGFGGGMLEGLTIGEGPVKANIAFPQTAGEIAAQKESQVRLEKFKEARPVIQQFTTQIGRVPGGFGPQGRADAAPGLFMDLLLQRNQDVVGYERTKEGMRPVLAKLTGDVGNLTDQEQEKAIKLLPDLYDSFEVRATGIANFYEFVIKRISARNNISPKTLAQTWGLDYDTRTGRVSSNEIKLLRYGKQPFGPSVSGAELVIDPETGDAGYRLPDGTIEEVPDAGSE